MPSDPGALLRSRSYLQLLAIAAILGVPVSAAAYGFLALVNYLQQEIFTHLPHGLGFHAQPVWWPLPVLAVGGVLAGLAIRYLPGNGGASPADGFKVPGPPTPPSGCCCQGRAGCLWCAYHPTRVMRRHGRRRLRFRADAADPRTGVPLTPRG
jgi:hypothetical protein